MLNETELIFWRPTLINTWTTWIQSIKIPNTQTRRCPYFNGFFFTQKGSRARNGDRFSSAYCQEVPALLFTKCQGSFSFFMVKPMYCLMGFLNQQRLFLVTLLWSLRIDIDDMVQLKQTRMAKNFPSLNKGKPFWTLELTKFLLSIKMKPFNFRLLWCLPLSMLISLPTISPFLSWVEWNQHQLLQ